jgi:cell division protein FtsA
MWPFPASVRRWRADARAEAQRRGAGGLGGGTTNYIAYCNNVISAAGCIAVGGDHVANDVALAFNIPLNRAEELKRTEGCAVIDPETSGRRVVLPRDVGFAERLISCKALHTVINALHGRDLPRAALENGRGGRAAASGRGVILDRAAAPICARSRIWRSACSVCRAGSVCRCQRDGLDSVEQPAALSTAAGLVLYGKMTYEDRRLFTPLRDLFRGVFHR